MCPTSKMVTPDTSSIPPGGPRALTLEARLAGDLRALADACGATLFATLLAAFQVLVARHSDREDTVVGALSGCAQAMEQEIVLPATLGDDLRFDELLGSVEETVRASVAVEGVGHCAFRIGLRCDPAAQELAPSMLFKESGAGLHAQIERCDRLDALTSERLLEHFTVLLAGIVADPCRRVSELPILGEAERQQILIEWNDTRQERRGEPLLHELFSAEAQRSPQAVAVVCAEERVTYAELDARANRLAHHLRRLGLAPEELVGVCLERSVEMVVGLLGVLKAGGAYVPLDPGYPRERLELMLADTGVRLLLTQEPLLSLLPSWAEGALCLDRDRGWLEATSGEEPSRVGDPDGLAYVIYTSGSTGRPKGAMNTHRAVCNRILWMQEAYGLTAADRVLQKTPFSFDVSVWEFFWPLAVGATLVVAKPGGHMDPSYLIDLIAREGVTTLHFVPPMLQVFLEQEGVERCGTLRRVMASGEALPAELERRFFTRLSAELHNLYGPTEAAVDVTVWRCAPESGRTSVPIGRPIANLSILVLDRGMCPVPVGVPGELHIGGVGLARGYWRRPDLTAERFVPDGWSGELGSRLYKTGDLVRFGGRGEIDYLGRFDQQVKIRGFRIELGEVEAALNRCPGVRESVVVAGEEPEGGKRLVAYVVASAAPGPPVGQLHSFLREALPEHMVPAIFVLLEALPLSPNGKVDRRALPPPGRERADLEESFAPPRNATEQALAQIWAKVIGVDRVGVRDSFFELGGQSLLALHMMTHIRNRFGVDLPLAVIFRAPTIEKLAAFIDGQSTHPTSHLIPMGGQELPAGPLFCVHGVGGHVFRLAELGRRVSRHRPFYGIQGWANLNESTHLGSVETMAQRYVDEVRRVQPQGPYRIAGYSMGGVVAYEMARMLTAAGESVVWLGLIDCSVPQPPEPVDPTKIISFEAGVADELGFTVSIDLLRTMRSEERLGYVVAEGLRVGALPSGFTEMDGRRYIQVFYATFSAYQRFVPNPWGGRLTLFRTAAGTAASPDPTLGWGACATGGVEIRDIPGDHITLVRQPHVEVLADQICTSLARAEAAEDRSSVAP